MGKKQERNFVRVRKTERGVYLVPASRHDADYVDGFPQDSLVEITIHKGRSRKRHRLYWATLHVVCENHGALSSPESLHKMLLLACGVTDPLMTVDGEFILVPSSTAFDAMSEADFQTYYKAATAIVAEKILPGVDLDALCAEAWHRTDTGESDAAPTAA